MDELRARELVADAGRMLLSEGLAARTWGNVSCRTGKASFVITPSGLGYEGMRPEDTVPYDMISGAYTGARRPSSEKGVHAAAYRLFPDAGFVLHTHQTYASALGLAGFDALTQNKADSEALGGLALAAYGLPGTKRLTGNVEKALSTGAHTVLMAHHGALIAGRDRDEAFARAKALEALCRANCKGQPGAEADAGGEAKLAALKTALGDACGYAVYTAAPAVIAASREGNALPAQLDDAVQMIGARLPVCEAETEALKKALTQHGAALVRGFGALCAAKTEGDAAALALLTEKSCVAFLHTRACGVSGRLSRFDTALMRAVYKQKYAKKIEQ